MRRVDWTDSEGYRRAVLLPDDAPESEAWMGIPIGPLPLGILGLSPIVERNLHNELHARGVLTADDLRRRRGEAVAAIAAALKLDVIALEGAWAAGIDPAPVDGRLAPAKIEDDVLRLVAEEEGPPVPGRPRQPRPKAPRR